MSRARVPSAVLLAVLATAGCAATASAKPFLVTTAGNSPHIAVDRTNVTHIVWDSTSADHTSTTHYCRVPRGANTCAAGSERTFAGFPADQDFGGPRVYLSGPRNITVITSRCCMLVERAPGEAYATRVYAYTSTDGGATFSEPVWIGTQVPDVGAILGSAGFFALGITENGTGLQNMRLDGFTSATNVVTPELAASGGVGVSPKGNLIAFATANQVVRVGALRGDANTATVRFSVLANGSDVVVASGSKGPDLLYRTKGKNARYVTRRFDGTKLSKTTVVSEAGLPIFGTIFQDPEGRVHAAWQGDRGLTYRRSAKSGRSFAKMRSLSRKFSFYSLVVAASPKGKATVAYDSNVENGRVGGFTTG